MSDNATQIRELIENWADAVHGGDLDAVLADHSDDIVMFDVTASCAAASASSSRPTVLRSTATLRS